MRASSTNQGQSLLEANALLTDTDTVVSPIPSQFPKRDRSTELEHGCIDSDKRTVVCCVFALGSDAAADTPTLLDAAGASDCKQPTRV